MNRPVWIPVAAAAATLSGCGLSNPMQNPGFPADHGIGVDAKGPAVEAALRVGEVYAVSARSLIASRLRADYGRQVRLAGQPLRRELEAVGPPSEAEILALHDRAAKTTATVDSTTVRSGSSDQVQAEVTLRERTVETGAISEQRATYLATIRRDALDGWRVTSFTAAP